MLVTYSLTIRRLQLEAAKCYTDPDDHLMIKSQTSNRLRRHTSYSKRRSSFQSRKKNSAREASTPSLNSPTTTDSQHQWP